LSDDCLKTNTSSVIMKSLVPQNYWPRQKLHEVQTENTTKETTSFPLYTTVIISKCSCSK